MHKGDGSRLDGTTVYYRSVKVSVWFGIPSPICAHVNRSAEEDATAATGTDAHVSTLLLKWHIILSPPRSKPL